jgi:hypothetical protein
VSSDGVPRMRASIPLLAWISTATSVCAHAQQLPPGMIEIPAPAPAPPASAPPPPPTTAPKQAPSDAPPGMIEIPNAPPVTTQPTLSAASLWWRKPHRRAIGFDSVFGFSCLALTHPTGGCFALIRAGFEFGWGDLHMGGLIGSQEDGYNPFTTLDEGGTPSGGFMLGFEAGSPFLRVARWLRIAARGAFDANLMMEHGQYQFASLTFTHGVVLAIDLTRGLSLTTRTAVGFGVWPQLVLNSGVGLQYAR